MTWSANDTRVLSSLMSLDNGQFSSMRNALCELTPFKRLLRADLPRVVSSLGRALADPAL